MKKLFLFATVLLFLGLPVDAQMIGATNNQQTPRTSTNNSLNRPTGSYLKISAGYPDVGTLAYNYQITPWLMAGIGGGGGFVPVKIVCIENNGDVYMSDESMHLATPVYAELELSTPKYKWSLFLNFKLGYYLASDGGYYHQYSSGNVEYDDVPKNLVSASVGASYMNLHMGVGYNVQGSLNFFVAYSLPLSLIGL